jgi:hypothetical protein
MISTRSVGLVIDTVVCLTLDKWETVSGQFGGYLSNGPGELLLAEADVGSQQTATLTFCCGTKSAGIS